jgi:hypothetical protein
LNEKSEMLIKLITLSKTFSTTLKFQKCLRIGFRAVLRGRGVCGMLSVVLITKNSFIIK